MPMPFLFGWMESCGSTRSAVACGFNLKMGQALTTCSSGIPVRLAIWYIVLWRSIFWSLVHSGRGVNGVSFGFSRAENWQVKTGTMSIIMGFVGKLCTCRIKLVYSSINFYSVKFLSIWSIPPNPSMTKCGMDLFNYSPRQSCKNDWYLIPLVMVPAIIPKFMKVYLVVWLLFLNSSWR